MYWPIDYQYYPGTVTDINENKEHIILYNDGYVETLRMETETWRPSVTEESVLQGSSIFGLINSCSTEKSTLLALYEYLGNKPFLKYEAQGFCQAPFLN